MELTEVLLKNSAVVSRTIRDQVILVPIRKRAGDLESIYTLNETAARIWELINGERTVGEILNTLCEEYDVTPETATEELNNLISLLKGIGVLDRSDKQ